MVLSADHWLSLDTSVHRLPHYLSPSDSLLRNFCCDFPPKMIIMFLFFLRTRNNFVVLFGWLHTGLINKITSTGRRGGRSGVRVYKAGRSPDETKRDEMKRSENERTKRKE